MSGATAPVRGNRISHVLLASAVGSALEWYDFFIYGTAAALVFGELFFPKYDTFAGTLAAYVTFGAGFLARPFGGLFFGHFGDRIGRKPMLVITLLLVGGGTFLIGLLPTYSAIGVWAPVLLLLMRLVQGFGAGAEYGGAVIFAVEYAPPGKRGLFGSCAPLGVVVGNLMAAGVFYLVSLLPHDDMLAWGWRIPFLISILLFGVGLYIRAKVAETPVFANVGDTRPRLAAPAIEAVRRHPRNFLVVIGARLAENGLGYLFPVFGLGYLINTLHMPRGTAIAGVMLGNAAEMVCVVLFAWLSDKVGRRPVYMGGALFCALSAFPFFMLADTRDPVLVAIAFMLVMGIGGGAMFGPQAAYFAELFGPRLRYSGFAFARELGSILAGGPSPAIAALLVGYMEGAPWGVACYVILLSLITVLAVWWGPETHTSDIEAEPADALPAGNVAATHVA
jgi:MHS family shikimate/dehydroshikimate transporter-like MFS transporter